MSLFRVTSAPDPIVSLVDMKNYLKIENDLEDRMLKKLVISATNAIERQINQRILSTEMSSTFTADIHGDYTMTVDETPLLSVDAGSLDVTTDYVNSKITIYDVPAGAAVTIKIEVGMTDDVDLVDGALIQAVLLLTSYWYDSRESADIPTAVLSLLRPFKRYAF